MNSTLTAQVSARIRGHMAMQRKTVQGMCLATGMAASTASRRLAGTSAWTLDEIAAVAAYLGISASDLIVGTSSQEHIAS